MADILKKIQLGKTGLEVSRLCYGTLTLGPYHSKLDIDKGAELLAYAYNHGVNFWDTAELYETYPYILKAMEILGHPDDLIISSRSFSRTYDEMKASLEKTLKALKVDCLPIFGLHELSSYQDFKDSLGAFSYLRRAKEAGKIKSIAITMHSIEGLNIAADQEWVEVVFPLYNKAGLGIIGGTASQMGKAIKNAYEAGKGVYAMKVLAGGHLSTSPEENIKFALDNPHIHSIAIGMDNRDEIGMNIALFNEDEEKVNFYKPLTKGRKKVIQVDPWCEGCGECVKICPNSAIRLEFSQAKVNSELCVLCGYCASACKMFCLKVVNIE